MNSGETRVADLVRAFKRREPGALDRLVPALQRNLVPIARMILRDPSAAEDAFIRTVTDLIERLDDLDPEAALGYCRRAMRSEAIDILRSRQVRDIRRAQKGAAWLRQADPNRQTEPVERVGGKATDPERKSLKAEARLRILAAIDELDPPVRDVIRTHLVEGKTIDECCAELGVSRSAIKRRLRIGRATLAKQLKDLRTGGGHV